MKKLLLVGAGLAVLAAGGVAVAQQPPGPPGGEGPPPRPSMEEGGRQMHGHGPMGRMMQMSKAAQFHFSRGDSRVDIRCAADEPTKACVDAAGALLDKLAAQR